MATRILTDRFENIRQKRKKTSIPIFDEEIQKPNSKPNNIIVVEEHTKIEMENIKLKSKKYPFLIIVKALCKLQDEHLNVHFKKTYLQEEKQIYDITNSIRQAFKRSFEFLQTLQGGKLENNARNALRSQLNLLNTEFSTIQIEYSESK